MIDFTITPAAAKQLHQVLEPGQMLRVAIKGGGCAGFEYQFEPSTEVDGDDMRFEQDQAVVLIDPISGQYLHGATLEYESNLFGARFVLKNPNAKTTCGCGESFAA